MGQLFVKAPRCLQKVLRENEQSLHMLYAAHC